MILSLIRFLAAGCGSSTEPGAIASLILISGDGFRPAQTRRVSGSFAVPMSQPPN